MFGGAVFVAFVVDGCREPTEVTLRISSDANCTDLRGVAISAAVDSRLAEDRSASSPGTVTRACASGYIGTIVVTPAETGSTAAIVVTAGVLAPAEECKPPSYKGCIVARRRFAFVDHTPLTIPIGLEVDCRDVPCDAVTTCLHGKCVDARIGCDDRGCGEVGGGSVTPDGGAPDGAISDGSPDGARSDAGDAASDAPSDAKTDGGDAGACSYSGPNEGNAWSSFSCLKGDGSFCIGYTIGHCANQSAYGDDCNTGAHPVCGPSICSATDKTSTVYRCLKNWCVYGCGPGGAPDFGAEPVGIQCTTMGGCGP